jgi:hypothetical protein
MLLTRTCLCATLLAVLLTKGLAATLVGTVYSNENGPSGRGTGQLRLWVRDRIVELRYKKPLPGRFDGPTCYEPGAMWTVEVKQSGDLTEIVKAACVGKLDETVHDAWLTAKSFLSRLHKALPQALEMISDEWRKGPDFDSIRQDLLTLRLDEYEKFGSDGRCLSVVFKNERSVNIRAGDDCYIFLGRRIINLEFDVSIPPAAPRSKIITVRLN